MFQSDKSNPWDQIKGNCPWQYGRTRAIQGILEEKRFIAERDSELIILYALNRNNDRWNVKNSIIHSIRKQDGKAQKRDYRKKERKKEVRESSGVWSLR